MNHLPLFYSTTRSISTSFNCKARMNTLSSANGSVSSEASTSDFRDTSATVIELPSRLNIVTLSRGAGRHWTVTFFLIQNF